MSVERSSEGQVELLVKKRVRKCVDALRGRGDIRSDPNLAFVGTGSLLLPVLTGSCCASCSDPGLPIPQTSSLTLTVLIQNPSPVNPA